RRDDLGEARRRCVEALGIAHKADLPRASAFALEGLASVTLLDGDARAAAWLLGAAATLRRSPGAAVGFAFAAGPPHDTQSVLAGIRRSLDSDAVSEAFAEGERDPMAAIANVSEATS